MLNADVDGALNVFELRKIPWPEEGLPEVCDGALNVFELRKIPRPGVCE